MLSMLSVARVQCSGASKLKVLQSSKKGLREFLRVLPNAHSSSSGIGDDAVVHIGKIHHLRHFESARLQEAPQNILKHKGTKIPDVRVVVHRRPAAVHAHFARFLRHEGLNFSAQGVMQLNLGHVFPVSPRLRVYLRVR